MCRFIWSADMISHFHYTIINIDNDIGSKTWKQILPSVKSSFKFVHCVFCLFVSKSITQKIVVLGSEESL